ncbi:MAG: hypothetical protein H6702_20770 [Myxococcales bacterium]|nr:hypothetical protein [Myxococcales bacterium]
MVGWAVIWGLAAGAVPVETTAVDARLAQADGPRARALAYDDRFALTGAPGDRFAAGQAYAQAGLDFCVDARDRLAEARQAGVAGAQAALDALTGRCTARVTGLGATQVSARPVPAADGKARAGDFRPLTVEADGGVLLWPGAWQLRLGEGPEARFVTLCAAPAVDRVMPPEAATRLPEDDRARSRAHNARGQALAPQDRCAAAAEFRLAADAALSETYLFNAGVALAGDPPDCAGARDAFDAFLARCNVCRGRDDVLARRKALEQTCEVSLAVKAPPGATVVIDQVQAPTRMVFPGRHEVTVTQPGMTPERRTVWVEGDTRVQVDLREAPPAPAVAAPADPTATPPGLADAPPIDPAEARRMADPWMLAGVVGGTVALGVGGGLLLAAEATDGELADLQGKPGATREEALSLADQRDTLRWVGWAGVGVGAAAAGFGLWRLLRTEPTAVTLAPTPSGFALGGRF